MPDFAANVAPRLVLLLILSPWIGVLTVWFSGRLSLAGALRAAKVNAGVTVCLATLLTASLMHDPLPNPAMGSGWGFHALRAVWPSTAAPLAAGSWQVHIAWSLGVDPVNAFQLLWLPWLTLAVLLVTPEPQWQHARFVAGFLALQGLFLLVFAAQDALTFCTAAELATILVWLLTGAWGGDQRREAADRYLRPHQAGQMFWLVGLVGLALAVVWAQQDLRSTPFPIRFDWSELSVTLPRLIARYVGSFQYWAQAGNGLLLVLLIGTCLRSGLMPFHGWWPQWLEQAAFPLAALQLGSAGLIGAYGLTRFMAPLFQPESLCADLLWWLGGGTALAGALLALAQSDLRQFSAYWYLSIMGGLWLGLGTGHFAVQLASWQAVQAVAALMVGWWVLMYGLHARYGTWQMSAFGGLAHRHPLLAGTAGALLIGLVGLPPFSRGLAEGFLQRAVLLGNYDAWWFAIIAALLSGWAAVWCYQQVFFGPVRTPIESESSQRDQPFAGVGFPPPFGQGPIPEEGTETPTGSTLWLPDLSANEFQAALICLLLPLVPWLTALWRGGW